MWNSASSCISGNVGVKHDSSRPPTQAASECSDDETSSSVCRDEEVGLECPICWESFNIVENVPHVLWCGHTLCKNCILGLQWAVVKIPTLPIQLPLFISCPWCNLLSFRLVYNGNVMFPRKNFFLLWMVESMNGDRVLKKTQSTSCTDHHHHQQPLSLIRNNLTVGSQASHGNLHGYTGNNYLRRERRHGSLHKSLVFLVHLTTKFPLIFLLIVLYAIPASAVILTLYILVTILFAFPSLLILYFAYPSLDWLVREIMT